MSAPGELSHTNSESDSSSSQEMQKIQTQNLGESDGINEKGEAGPYTGSAAEDELVIKSNSKRIQALAAMSVLWVGSQIPVYLFGSIPPIIYGDIGGYDRWIWMVLAHLLALASVCPFVGSISDLIGRRYVAIASACFMILGMIVCSTAQNMNIFICGMTFAGVGAGVSELTALASVSEICPTSQRGTYLAVLIFSIVPFTPSVLYAQLLASKVSWRYVGLFCGIWIFIALLMVIFMYHPPPRANADGLSKRQILKQIDYLGGLLSICGFLFFLMGLQWAGDQYSWTSAHVLAPLILGIIFIISFVVWEGWLAPYPMWPKRLREDPRVLSLTLVITFVSGFNFFAILMFWPTQSYNMYGTDPVQVGLRGLPIGLAIMTGAIIVLILLSYFKGAHLRVLLVIACCFMTAGTGAMAVARPDNMNVLWPILIIAGLGIGGLVVPTTIITMIVCPDDLIGTVAALTLAIRVLGGGIGYCIYYNIFRQKFVPAMIYYIGGAMEKYLHIYNKEAITAAIEVTAAAELWKLKDIPGLESEAAQALVTKAGYLAYADAYKYVYYVSIAFGAVSILAACFLGDIKKYMNNNNVAVKM